MRHNTEIVISDLMETCTQVSCPQLIRCGLKQGTSTGRVYE